MTAIKSTSTSTSSTPQCQTPVSQTPLSRSPRLGPQTTSDKQRAELEQRLETNWNGLLLNDYLNCDSYAAEELFANEREELEHPEEYPSVAKKVQTFLQKARDAVEKRLEADWNGLVWNDYMNCDSSSLQDLWAEERRQLEEVKDEPAKQSEEKWSSTNTGL